jgi:hypothetical protein
MSEKTQNTLVNFLADPKLHIKIPIIQRDYAQGRRNQGEVRDNFLSALYEHLVTGTRIDLDFIYGSIETNKNFIPLDGQQRLTTLLLLHWYLSHKENQVRTIREMLSHEGKSRFTYETRSSSREFCDMLVTAGIDYSQIINNSIEATIVDQPWFYLSWQCDPTVKSMLTMLEAIHVKFAEAPPLLDRLIDKENPVITFQFLNLDAFSLTDDLYIKMNARGKPLTLFETFKAKLEQHIATMTFPPEKTFQLPFEEATNPVSIQDYFAYKIDTDWANMFWQYRNEKTMTFDDEVMNLFRVLATNYVALNDNNLPNLKRLIGDEKIGFRDYQETIGCLTPPFIIELIEILDFSGMGLVNERNLFQKATSNRLNYSERIRFFAIVKYLLSKKPINGLDDWIRVIFNLTENTPFNEVEEFVRALQTVNRLLVHSHDILARLSSNSERLAGFLELQVAEERIKACLLIRSEPWRNKILDIEKHAYFKGQISFLLNFSGIEFYFQQHNSCTWPEGENNRYWSAIETYYQKANSLFDKDGLKPIPEFLFERALLSIGDYLLVYKRNKSFLVNPGRDNTWKRLLRDDNEGKRDFVKQLLDRTAFDTANVPGFLSRVVGSSEAIDWRSEFIKMPELLTYLGPQRYIRFYSPENIQLLRGERITGQHADYRSYSYFCKLKDGKKDVGQFDQFSYHEARQDDGSSWCDLTNKEGLYIRIEFQPGSNQYRIFISNHDNSSLAPDLLAFLEARSFKSDLDKRYYLMVDNELQLDKILSMLCSELTTAVQASAFPR